VVTSTSGGASWGRDDVATLIRAVSISSGTLGFALAVAFFVLASIDAAGGMEIELWLSLLLVVVIAGGAFLACPFDSKERGRPILLSWLVVAAVLGPLVFGATAAMPELRTEAAAAVVWVVLTLAASFAGFLLGLVLHPVPPGRGRIASMGVVLVTWLGLGIALVPRMGSGDRGQLDIWLPASLALFVVSILAWVAARLLRAAPPPGGWRRVYARIVLGTSAAGTLFLTWVFVGSAWSESQYKNQGLTEGALRLDGAILELQWREHGSCPRPGYRGPVRSLHNRLGPLGGNLANSDAWGHEILYRCSSDGRHYVLLAPGRDGVVQYVETDGKEKTLDEVGEDTVFSDGNFLQRYGGWEPVWPTMREWPEEELEGEVRWYRYLWGYEGGRIGR